MTEPWEDRWIDYYELLEVHRKAHVRRIKKSYFDLLQEHHPDHGGDQRRAQLLNEAWEILGDEGRRRQYDYACDDRTRSGGQHYSQPPRQEARFERPIGDVEIRGDVRFVRFQRQQSSDFLTTDLTLASRRYGRLELRYEAAYIGQDGLGGRVELTRGHDVGLQAVFADNGSFDPKALQNYTTGLGYRLVTGFEAFPAGEVECSGIVRNARIQGQYGNDFKDVELVISSPQYGTCRFQFSALWGKYFATKWLEIQRGDQVTLAFENAASFRPIRFDNHTRGVSYPLNSGWTTGLSILDALGNIGRAFRR